MCEPYHSIIQYDPNRDDDDDDFGGSSQPTYTKSGLLSSLGSWAKKVRGWFHASKIGSGHTGVLEARTGLMNREIRKHFALFETAWWNRSTKWDYGGQILLPHEKEERNAAAAEYSQITVTGDLTKLRNFLELSFKKTDHPGSYALMFLEMLNAEGRDIVNKKHRQYFGTDVGGLNSSRINPESLAKFLVGFTRKRNLLIPEWADDTKLWTPK